MMNAQRIKVVMLAGLGMSSRVMYHELCSEFDVIQVFIENKVPARKLIGTRLKRLGLSKVIGQILFIAFNKIIAKMSQSKIKELLRYYKVTDEEIPEEVVRRVESVNRKEVTDALRELKPDVIVVNGTRIISEEVLSSIDVPFINTHMGITPKYRGVHGGYWALAHKDNENCGVTVHFVDKGIDTGEVLYQERISVQSSDNFNTYPIHQIAKAIPLMKAALNDVAGGRIKAKSGVYPSQLWYHPTLYEYLKYRIIYGVK